MVRAAPKRLIDGIVVLRVGGLRPPLAAFPWWSTNHLKELIFFSRWFETIALCAIQMSCPGPRRKREADREHYLEAFRRAGLE